MADEPNLLRVSTAIVGGLFLALGAAILPAAAFVLPERIPVFHDHPVHEDAGSGRPTDR